MATLLAGLRDRNLLATVKLEAIADDDLQAILTAALTAAAINCERKGCNPPTSQELDAALAS